MTLGGCIGFTIYGLKKGLITVAMHNLLAHLTSLLVPLIIFLGKLQELQHNRNTFRALWSNKA